MKPNINKSLIPVLLLACINLGCLYDYGVKSDYYRESLKTYEIPEVQMRKGGYPDTVTVQDCIRYVVEYNPDLRQLLADGTMAKLGVDIAMSYLIPKISVEANQAISHWEMDEYADPSSGDAPKDLLSARVSTRFVLWDWGISRFMVQQRYRDTDAARAGAKGLADRLAYNTASLFYSIKAMESDIELMGRSITSLELKLKDTEVFFDNGMAPKSAVLKLTASLDDLKYRKTSLENGKQKALMSLKQLMGFPLGKEITLEGTYKDQTSFIVPETAVCIEAAMNNRPDITAAQAMIESAQFGLKAVKAQRWPLFLISAEVQWSDLDWMPHQGFRALGNISMSWDAFTGGENRAEIEIEREKLRKARLSMKKAKDEIQYDVTAALLDLNELKKQNEAAEASAASAARNLEEVTSLYQNQKATATELVDAETALLKAESSLNKIRYRFCTLYHALEKSMGISLEKPFPESEPEGTQPEDADEPAENLPEVTTD